jgi:hypothetical protein
MNDPIQSKAAICADAHLAARFVASGGVEPKCPHEEGTEAASIWRAAFARHLHEMRAEEGTEASA